MERPWNYLHEEQLKLLSFRDLELDLEDTILFDWICEFQEEIEKKGLRVSPHYTIGTEWFVPDGSLGISVPYYLLHPRLAKLHQKEIPGEQGQIEGQSKSEFFMYLRHELGHVMDNAFHLRKLKSRQELFGLSSVNYPKSYTPNPDSDNFVQHFPNFYAQAHPDEDWAETFAEWMTMPIKRWREKYRGKSCLHKLEYVNEIMRSLKFTRPKFGKRTCLYSIENSTQTLQKFYRQKNQEAYGRLKPFFKKECEVIFAKSLETARSTIRKKQATELIEQNRQVIINRISKSLGRNSFEVERLISDLKTSAQNLYLKSSEEKTRSQLLAIIDGKSHDFYKKGFHRILM